MFKKNLTNKTIKAIYDKAIKAPDSKKALEILSPLIESQATNNRATDTLIDVIKGGYLTIEHSLAVLSDLYEVHKGDDYIVIQIGNAMEAVRDINCLNAAPPEESLFIDVITRLSEIASTTTDPKKEVLVVESLSSTARLMAWQYDEIAEKNYARLVELLPDAAWAHYNQGLFFKTRGRFSEGVKANQKAMALAKETDENYLWNLGICATGSRQGEVALEIWKEVGQKIEMGRFELPEGVYPSCKVRLAERPLSQRDSEHDDPGLEETVWIERLSPCHGIIRSVLYQDLDVDYGDVILFDGAPITYHKYGDQQIPVFPHLATIQNNNYQFFDFAGTQSAQGEISELSAKLEKDAVIYSHTENYRNLCSICWRDKGIDHEHLETEDKHVVIGRIAVPQDIQAKDVLDAIDNALKGKLENRIFSPDLCRAAGLDDRAKIEERRYHLLYETTE